MSLFLVPKPSNLKAIVFPSVAELDGAVLVFIEKLVETLFKSEPRQGDGPPVEVDRMIPS